jgi:hypothetical protein
MQLTTQPSSIIATIASSLAEQTRQQITSEGNFLILPPAANEGELKHIISRLGAMQGSTERLDSMLRYYIGRTVLSIVASCPIQRSVEEVIDEYDIPALVGRSAATVKNWTYVSRVIPPEELRAVSWTVLSEAAAKVPSEPDKALEWREKRQELLAEAEEHPEAMTAKKARERIKEMQAELCPKERSVRESTQELMLRFVKLSRLARVAHSGQLQEIGIESHGVLVDLIENLDNELVNREICEADPLAESFYWLKKTQETEEQ